jgi:hypothetical protein
MRPCCYRCPYKSLVHPGDITIGDYWGIEGDAPGFADEKGVSLLLVNSSEGDRLFHCAEKQMVALHTTLVHGLQPVLVRPFTKPKSREEFWDHYLNHTFSDVARKYGNNCLRSKLKLWVRKVLRGVLRKTRFVRSSKRLNKSM